MELTADEIRGRLERLRDEGRETLPIFRLVGNIPTEGSLQSLRELRQLGEIEQIEPGYWVDRRARARMSPDRRARPRTSLDRTRD